MKKVVVIPIIFLCTLLSLYSQEFSLQLKWFHQFQFAGYYMAQNKGFYEEEGLNINILEGGPEINVAAAVETGRAQFGVLGSEILLHKAESRDFVVLAPIMQHSIRAIFADKEKGIYTLSDLIDQEIMLNFNEIADFQAMFIREGIDFDKLTISPKNSSANSLFIKGEIDALNGSIANQSFIFDKAEKSYTTFRPITYGIDFYGDTLFTKQEVIRGDNDAVSSFLKASLQGWDYAFQHPDETINVIINHFGSSKTREQLYKEYEVLKNLIAPELVQIGHNNPERWKHIEETYRSLNLIKGELDLENFFYNPDRLKERWIRIFWRLLIALLLISILFLLRLWFSNIKLNRLVFVKSAQLNSVIESLPILLIGIDCSFSITLWNDNANKITGLGEREALGKNLFEVLPDLTALKEDLIEHMKDNKVFRNTRQKFIENGLYSYMDVSLFPFSEDRNNCAVLKIEDVTAQVEMGESMAQNERLLSLGRMAAGLAHEINNPLAGIVQSSNVINNRILKKIDSPANKTAAEEIGISIPKMREYMQTREIPRLMETISESTKRISHIIDGFLSYSRKGNDHTEVFSIPDVVEKTLSLASIEYNLKNDYDFSEIGIYRDYDHSLPGIESYKNKLQQVLLNIFRNGAQAMHRSGTDEPQFTIGITYDDVKGFHISIEDNGPGIPNNVLSKIFDPFFTTKSEGMGTGLGLSMSYYLLKEYMNGDLKVESRLGEGAKFTISLPANIKSEPEYYL